MDRKAGSTYITWAILLALACFTLPVTAQRARPVAAPRLPPLAMTCPMHPDVVEDKPGSCPLCRMALVPVRLESVWSCPLHSAVIQHAKGTCPICKRDLVQMTVALTWTCNGRPDIDQIEPGRCPDGSPTVAKRTLRPHGNHNPQHGGQFFMAPDNWHHLEGAYPSARVFRLYLYDDYARPLPLDQVKQIKARVVTRESFDAATRRTSEQAAFPLVAGPGGTYLEARVDPATLPAAVTAKVRFKPDAQEYRFDFTFPAVTVDPSARQVVTRSTTRPTRTTTARATASAPAPARVPATAQADARDIDPALIQLPIPEATSEILAQLATRRQQIGELIDRGNFAAVFVPAFQAKDLAVALEERLDAMPPSTRERVEPAIQRLVRAAWMLDAAGDVGNRQQLTDAYRVFSSAVNDVITALR